jgi:hypothetical protein
LQIEHFLSSQEGVIVMWFAPEYFENTDENIAVREMVQEYMIVAVIHFAISNLGVWRFENSAEVTVELGKSELLTPLPQERLPPLVNAEIKFLQDVMVAGLGKVGEGMRFFVYEGKHVNRCADEVLWINYLRERYTYQTPLPGCE